MLLRSLASVVLAFAHLIMADDDDGFSNLSSCGQNCVNNMRTSTGCVPVTDSCLCASTNFIYGITDCANAACSSSDAQAALTWAESWCAEVTGSTSTTAATSTAEATSTSVAATTTSESTTSVENAQPTTSESTSTTLAAQATTSTSSSDAAATSDAANDASSTGTGASLATDTSSASSSSPTGTSSSSSSSDSDKSSSSGLTAGAKAGIVVGAAGAAILVVAAVLYLSRKRKKPLPRGTMKISEPLPGSGRIGDDVWERYHSPPPFSPMYSSKQQLRPPQSAGSNYSELDRHARPYENMVPRMTPTRMV